MRQLVQLTASKIGVEPAIIKKLENHGMCFFVWSDSDLAGGQCQKCHNLLWVYARRDPILSESKPSNVPSFGPGYTAYYHENLERFLSSLPACPNCGCRRYDKFINNVSFPRLEDGTEINMELGNDDVVYLDPNTVKVWLYD